MGLREGHRLRHTTPLVSQHSPTRDLPHCVCTKQKFAGPCGSIPLMLPVLDPSFSRVEVQRGEALRSDDKEKFGKNTGSIKTR